MNNKVRSFGLILLSVMTSSTWAVNDGQALSTSGLVGLSYKNDKGVIINSCSDKKASFGENYVSIGIKKLTVNKNDGIVRRIVSNSRQVFSAVNLKADYNSQAISISKVSKPVSLSGANSSVDLGVQWVLIDRTPWILKNPSLDIRIGYGADSTIEGAVNAFNGITSAIPSFTLSTPAATGIAVTSAIDKLLFAADHAIILLRASSDIPLMTGQLCEGYYATFSAENNASYEKYIKGTVIWTGNDLEYDGKPIHDVSYSVVSVKISDRYYPSASAAFNDNSLTWTAKYREVLSSLYDLTWVNTPEEIVEREQNIRSALSKARILLESDLDLIQKEKQEIDAFAQNEALEALNNVKKNRIVKGNRITKESTHAAIEYALSKNSVLVNSIAINNAKLILENSAANQTETQSNVGQKLMNTVKRLDSEFRLDRDILDINILH